MLWSVGNIVCEADGSCRHRSALAISARTLVNEDGELFDGSVMRPYRWDPLDPYALFIVAKKLHPRSPVVLNMRDPFDPDVKR